MHGTMNINFKACCRAKFNILIIEAFLRTAVKLWN